MSYRLCTMAVAGAVLLALAGCNDSGNGGGNGQTSIQRKFGQTFATAFNADANAEPIDPQEGDLPPVTLTQDPIDF